MVCDENRASGCFLFKGGSMLVEKCEWEKSKICNDCDKYCSIEHKTRPADLTEPGERK